MTIINSDEQLRSLIPNVLLSVKGETSLLDKMRPFLDDAESWVMDNITSEPVFSTIAAYDADNQLRALASKIVCMEAFRNAIPFLDLVLTPNGFGIVSNTNVAPASKERVDRLILRVLSYRDSLLSAFVAKLPSVPSWLETEQALFLGSTLFPNISLTDHFASEPNKWDHFIRLREQLLVVEHLVEEQYLSKELMDVFRSEVLSGAISAQHRAVIASLQSVEIVMLKSILSTSTCSIEYNMLTNIVDVVRKDSLNFPEWHASSLKHLYSPPVFENKKKDTGYWF